MLVARLLVLMYAAAWSRTALFALALVGAILGSFCGVRTAWADDWGPLLPGHAVSPEEEVWTSDESIDFGRLVARRANENPLVLPEPMVFDLVRPLGARRGELEVNVLGLVPLNRRVGTTTEIEDPLGLVVRSRDTGEIEWAPEIEWAVWDGFALEFELPYEGSRLEAYKGAAQVTFGTAFDNNFIHGAQTIAQYDIEPHLTTLTFLYIAGVQIDEVWSVLSMFGFRSEIRGRDIQERTETLANVSLFATVADDLVLGVETNVARAMDGLSTLLVMPQMHWALDERWELQTGVGMRFTESFRLPEAGFRVIRTF